MEFGVKLQQLRKQKGLTQEELAEKLYVSRTAVSKWESGKGYPNIESLKSLSRILAVSIDALLSGDELLAMAVSENRSNMSRMFGYIHSVLDMMAIGFILLPLYGQPAGAFIQAVNLIEYTNTTKLILAIYWTVFASLAVLGTIQLVLIHFDKEMLRGLLLKVTFMIDIGAIIFLFATREPYAGALLFSLFVIKVLAMLKEKRS